MVENYKCIFTHSRMKVYSLDESHPVSHRLDGPAVEFVSGMKVWAYCGEQMKCSSQEEFERILKLKGFL